MKVMNCDQEDDKEDKYEGGAYDGDVGHLEGDGVEDNNEKNGDENVGAEEESKEGDGSDAVTEK